MTPTDFQLLPSRDLTPQPHAPANPQFTREISKDEKKSIANVMGELGEFTEEEWDQMVEVCALAITIPFIIPTTHRRTEVNIWIETDYPSPVFRTLA